MHFKKLSALVDWCMWQSLKYNLKIRVALRKDKCQYLVIELICGLTENLHERAQSKGSMGTWMWHQIPYESLSLTSSWLCALTSVKPMGCLKIVLALCGECKLRKSIFHLLPSIASVFHRVVYFFTPQWKKGSRATPFSCWLYCLDLCKSTSECVRT